MASQKANSIDRPLRIGLLHYSCPPVVGGVEEIVSQHAHTLSMLGQSVSVLAGMGEVYTDSFPVRIEPVIGSKDPQVSKAHVQSRKGDNNPLRDLTNRILTLFLDWSHDFDVVLAHNVLQLPFNLPLTLALRRQASSRQGPVLVSWAHDSPYFEQNCPRFLNHSPWDVLKKPHPNIQYVTISKCRKELFQEHDRAVKWTVINNGIDPVTFFYLDEKSVKLASELDLFNRDLVVVQPSRVTPRKNLELSIHIIRGIKNLGYNVIFILTGAYDPHEARAVSYYRRLRYWINELDLKDNIAVLAEYRFKDRARLVPDRIFIRDLYLMADLLLMTSKDEGFGLPLLEAGMIKLPIACTEIPPFMEVGKDVCFFRPSDPPLFIAGRIIEYLSRTTTHRMFRKVMKEYILYEVCKNDLLPYLFEITGRTAATG
jgi:glycosyltransferase involved in cell wall biosynthesis